MNHQLGQLPNTQGRIESMNVLGGSVTLENGRAIVSVPGSQPIVAVNLTFGCDLTRKHGATTLSAHIKGSTIEIAAWSKANDCDRLALNEFDGLVYWSAIVGT
jgi:hypothetical protein